MTIKLQLLGHASFKMKVNEKVVYIDPHGGDDSLYDEKADLILATHEHGDHSNPKKIALVQGEGTKILTSSKNAPNIKGNVISIDPNQKQDIFGITIHGVYGYNVRRFREPNVLFHPKGIQTAFIIEAEGKRIYFAGDTDFIEEMNQLKNIDVALLPIDGKYTMSPEEALQAVGAIQPKMVIPMHWRDKDPEKFKAAVEAKYSTVKVTVIKPSEEFEL